MFVPLTLISHFSLTLVRPVTPSFTLFLFSSLLHSLSFAVQSTTILHLRTLENVSLVSIIEGSRHSSQSSQFKREFVDVEKALEQITHLILKVDLICATKGTEAWLKKLKWEGLQSFLEKDRTPIYCGSDKTTKGFFKSFKNLHFYWILGAGHYIHYLENGSVEIYSRQAERNTEKFSDVATAVSRKTLESAERFWRRWFPCMGGGKC
ncbi:hypothetical protein V8G54_002629 [Vigna mungo]|uniref:Uncharacterized protein n=1 Tax=Vigna mungo TaxID=3915 RepID=A0AAQ3PAK7_VIGMU